MYIILFIYVVIDAIGPFNLTIDNVEGTYDLTGHVTNDTWVVEHFTTLPSVRKMKIYLEEIFNSKEISKKFNYQNQKSSVT